MDERYTYTYGTGNGEGTFNSDAALNGGSPDRMYTPEYSQDLRTENVPQYTHVEKPLYGTKEDMMFGATKSYGTYYNSDHGEVSRADIPDKENTSAKNISRSGNKKTKSKKNSLARTIAYGLTFGLVAGAAFGGVNYGISRFTDSYETGSSSEGTVKTQDTGTGTGTGTASGVDVADIVEKSEHSIVSINTVVKETVQYFFQSYEQESTGAGSGIIIGQTDDVLYISTNFHVINGASEITVGFGEGETARATVRGYDEAYDIAVLEVKKADMSKELLDSVTIAKVGNSDDIRVGEMAVAIGNPLGIGQSVTVGYISALSRTIEDYSGNFIQTDAAINPGNSGGALLNANGEVIGVTSSKYVDSSVEGMGFAIPINKAMELINDIISGTGNVRLGVGGVDITSDYASIYGFPEGVYVKSVEAGSAAASAGIEKGDIIVSIDGIDTLDVETLSAKIKTYEQGDKATVGLYKLYGNEYKKTEIEVTF